MWGSSTLHIAESYLRNISSFWRNNHPNWGSSVSGTREIVACGLQSPGLWKSTIQFKEQGIPLTIGIRIGIQFPLTKNLESSTWSPVSTAWNPESRTVLVYLKAFLFTAVFRAVISNCFSKNFFKLLFSYFPERYKLRGAEMALHELALCMKDGPSRGKLVVVITAAFLSGFVWVKHDF